MTLTIEIGNQLFEADNIDHAMECMAKIESLNPLKKVVDINGKWHIAELAPHTIATLEIKSERPLTAMQALDLKRATENHQ